MLNETLSYVLITPARNAEALIELTIKSVVRQTVLPSRWIIVNDGSVDGTEEIVRNYVERFSWIDLLQSPKHSDYDFSAKARCFNAALEKLKDLEFDVVANIDSDVSFEEDYFAFLLKKLEQHPELGVVGTPMREPGHDSVDDALFNDTDVFGACQVFRRGCMEDIGGYLSLKHGGVDWAAVRMARMKGWETRSFLEKRFLHHRIMGATESGVWWGMFNHGRKDYRLGNHPVWQLFRAAYQMTCRPRIIKGLFLFAGYVWEFVAGPKRLIPKELVRFHRREQRERLRSMLGAAVPDTIRKIRRQTSS